MHVVLDTNIFVSMLMGGQVGYIHDAWKEGKFFLVISDAILLEYLDIFQRPKLHLSSQGTSAVIERIQRKAKFVTPTEAITVVEADPSDNIFLEAALEGKVDCIVSGDSHLLELKTFRDIPILPAREFITLLKSRE